MTYLLELTPDGLIDELVVRESPLVHLQQMADGEWWLRIDQPHGAPLIVTFTSSKRITAKVQDD